MAFFPREHRFEQLEGTKRSWVKTSSRPNYTRTHFQFNQLEARMKTIIFEHIKWKLSERAALIRSWLPYCVLCLLLVGAAHGQIIPMGYVDITGNSIAQFQGGFQLFEFPTLPSTHVTIFGMDGYTCGHLAPLILYLVPADTNVVVLYDSTNDVSRDTPVTDLLSCIHSTINQLIQRNSHIQIVLTNTPPWTQWDPCNQVYRNPAVLDIIDAYNTAYIVEPWPVNVTLMDVWTPNADPQTRWALPQYMTGPCGIHPGPDKEWTDSWSHFTTPISAVVKALLLHPKS
jgi:hypothetical protein